jgi:hypothetical protein
VDIREHTQHVPACLKKYAQCPYAIPDGRREAAEREQKEKEEYIKNEDIRQKEEKRR